MTGEVGWEIIKDKNLIFREEEEILKNEKNVKKRRQKKLEGEKSKWIWLEDGSHIQFVLSNHQYKQLE